MGLYRVSAGDPVLRVDIAEVVWNVADWIPVLRGSFDFGRDSFDRINGARWAARPVSKRLLLRRRFRSHSAPERLCNTFRSIIWRGSPVHTFSFCCVN